MQIVEFLFLTPLGQTIISWTLIILASTTITISFYYFWTMVKGGIPVWVLYVKGGARFGRMYKGKETDTAIIVGKAKFLKPVVPLKDKKGKIMQDEHGKDIMLQINPPLTFWKRIKAARLYLVAEGVAQILSWKQLIEGLPQTQLTPEQLKNDPQVEAAKASIETFGTGTIGKWVIFFLVLFALAIGFFMAYAGCATGVLPIRF